MLDKLLQLCITCHVKKLSCGRMLNLVHYASQLLK
jgi:hypothetical protein